MKVRINITGMNSLRQTNEKAIKVLESGKDIEAELDSTVRRIKYHAPRRTGFMLKHVRWKKKGQNKWSIICDDIKASWLEFGTRFFPVGTVDNPRAYTCPTTGKAARVPFMRPEAHRMRKRLPGRIKKTIVELYK